MNVRGRTYLALSVGALLACGVSIAACDVTVIALDDGGFDASFDTSIPDTSSKPDAKLDTGTDADATADADASAPDADAGPSYAIRAFAQQFRDAFCQEIQNCCPGVGGNPSPVDLDACKAQFPTTSYQGYFEGWPGLNQKDEDLSPNLALNVSKSAACLADIKKATCVTNGRPAAEESKLFLDCSQSVEGTVPVGGTCAADIECSTGGYCAAGVDGGAGKCTALARFGEPCILQDGSTTTAYRDTCSNHGTGDTGLKCIGGACAARLPLGSTCTRGQICASGACSGNTGTCDVVYGDEFVCTYFPKQ